MRSFILCLLLPCTLFAKKVLEYPLVHPDFGLPWLTGPLLTPSALTVPPGHFNIEPYFYVVANQGIYQEDWSVQKNDHVFLANSVQVPVQVGLLSWLDVQVVPILYYNYTDGVGSWAFGDLPVNFDIQLYNPPLDGDGWIPHIKLVLKETFPTGKYQKLKAAKKGTDAGGDGSFITSFGIVLGELIHFKDDHFMTLRLAGQYSIPTAVHLKGLNTYGGTETTNGVFYLPQNAQASLGLEYSLTRHWALALDIAFNWASGSNFSGDAETDEQLSIAPVGADPLIQYSLAPAIEYNWNAHVGLIAGSWFTIAGKNAVQFVSGIIALNIYY